MNSRESAELNGCVEFRQFGAWFDLIDAGVLIGKNYDLFACLFGVTNFAGFRPLFPGRGLPEDCGDALKQKFESAPGVYFGASWVSYEELKTVDWNEEAERFDERIHEYAVAADGTESFLRKMLRDSSADELLNLARRDGVAWAGGRVFRRRVIRRREAIVDSDFLVLMELMSVLAVRFGDANVRVVVFFD